MNDVRERRRAADAIRRLRDRMAEAVTEEFLSRHPDWVERYGDRARRHGIEDARFHADFLASAIEAGSAAAFRDYARWTARMLGARDIAPPFLAENLQQVGTWLESALDEAGAALTRETITAGITALSAPTPAPASLSGGALDLTRSVFTQACLAGDRRAALNVVREAVREGHAIPDVYVNVLQESQYEIGRLWEANRISVGQEHVATAITQYVVTHLHGELERAEQQRGPAVVTGIKGELHQLGGMMVADLLDADGWDVRFLGTDLPESDIVDVIVAHETVAVGISATMLFNLPAVTALIEAVRATDLDPTPKIVVGGGLFRSTPDLWNRLGADGFGTDLRQAVQMFRAVAGEDDVTP